MPDAEVVLDAVQSVAERVAFGARLGDRLRDAADDRRDDEDAEQVVDRHEGAFQLQDRVIHLAEGQGPQSRPKNQPRTSCSISPVATDKGLVKDRSRTGWSISPMVSSSIVDQ